MIPRFLRQSLGEIIVRVFDFVESRPSWLRPPLYGAVFIYAFEMWRGALILGPILLVGLAIKEPSTAWRLLLVLVALAPAAGFAGGLLYILPRPLTKHLGKAGTLIQCLFAGFGYGAFLTFLIVPVMDSKPFPPLSDGSEWFVAGLIGVIGGLAIGVPMISKSAT
jgi:hypothetical protein